MGSWTRTGRAALIGAFASVTLTAAEASPYSSLYVFGDSYSDAGNAYALTGGTTPPSPPYAGRFSNGPVAVEYLASALGIPFTYSLDPAAGPHGRDYAIGGAETGSVGGIGLANQVASFQQDVAASKVSFAPASALFVLEGGGNDIFDDIATTPPATIISNAARNIASEATALYASGARQIGIASLFHIGLTPDGAASGAAMPLNTVADALNAAYTATVAALDASLPGADVFLLDTGAIINTLLASPSADGFSNASTPCLTGLTVCANPNAYVFWDGRHPTTRFHDILGNALAAELLPEPGGLVLIASGLIGLAVLRSRSRAS